MYQLQAPGVLQNLDKVPLDMTLAGLDNLNRAQELDSMGMQDTSRRLAFDTQADPMRLQQLDLGNQTSLAQLPGIKAQSRMRQLDADRQERTHELEISKLLKQYKADEVKQYVSGISTLGVNLRNAAGLVASNPVGGRWIAKQMLEQSGQGEFWNPDWDNLPPGQLAMAMSELGTEIQSNGDKYTQALDSITTKGSIQERLQQQRLEAQLLMQRERSAAAERLKKMASEAGAKKDPTTLNGLAARFGQLAFEAQAEGDPKAAEYAAAQQTILEQMRLIASAGADARAATGINVPGVSGLPANAPPAPMPPVVQPQAAPTKPAAQKPQHTLSQLKQMYPGKSDAEIKAAYKAKFGVEPQ